MSLAPAPRRAAFTPEELIDFQIDRLHEIKRGYANTRRPHSSTERLADDLTDVGKVLHRIGRGACRPS